MVRLLSLSVPLLIALQFSTVSAQGNRPANAGGGNNNNKKDDTDTDNGDIERDSVGIPTTDTDTDLDVGACLDHPDIFSETIAGMPAYSYSGNPNCKELGYSFGWKMEGCKPEEGVIQFDSMDSRTQELDGGCDSYANVGGFHLFGSSPDGDSFIDATIKPSVDAVVIMKGGNGGVVYGGLKADHTYTFDVGARKAISHIEFCFMCPGCDGAGNGQGQIAGTGTGTGTETTGGGSGAGTGTETETTGGGSGTGTDTETTGGGTDTETETTGGGSGTGTETETTGGGSGTGTETGTSPGADTDFEPRVAQEEPERTPNRWDGLNLYQVVSQGIPIPDCDEVGQNESFQGTSLRNDAGECKKINICHGNANHWNLITVDRDALGEDNNGNNGHANAQHNRLDQGNKFPDFFPGTYSTANVNGAGKNGYVNGDCGFEPDVVPVLAPPEFPEEREEPEETPAPTSSPTEGPEVPDPQPEAPDSDTTGDTATRSAFTRGDPHFKTFGGELYDYHGQCDLVLLDNPKFKNNLGMTIHIRTKIQDFWSSVDQAAIKIGDDVIEVAGGDHNQWLWVNGEANEELEEGKWHRTSIAGFLVRFQQTNAVREANIYIEGVKDIISIRTYQEFVRVDIPWQGNDNFEGSTGLLGSLALNGARVARDGSTAIEDVNEFGQMWQVLESEDNLFHNYDDAIIQAPSKCMLPPTMTSASAALRKRRLAQSDLTVEMAEAACAHADGDAERKACVFDVLSVQDINMAGAW